MFLKLAETTILNQPINPFIRPRGRKRFFDRDDLNFIESILLAEPALFFEDKLHGVRAVRVEVSISTLSRTLNRLAITHKAVTKEAMEWNEHLHATWRIVMAQYDARQLVFIDEAGVDYHTNIRTNGRAPLGQACVHRTNFLRGQKYSILLALSLDGILALDLSEGSVNRERFVGFLCEPLICFFFHIVNSVVHPLSQAGRDKLQRYLVKPAYCM